RLKILRQEKLSSLSYCHRPASLYVSSMRCCVKGDVSGQAFCAGIADAEYPPAGGAKTVPLVAGAPPDPICAGRYGAAAAGGLPASNASSASSPASSGARPFENLLAGSAARTA